MMLVGSMGQSAGPDGNWSESFVVTDCQQVDSLPPESIYGRVVISATFYSGS